MKNIIFLLSISLFLITETKAQNAVKWPQGFASLPTATVTSKVTAQSVTVDNRMVIADLGTVDTNKVITLTGASLNPYGTAYKPQAGDILLIKYSSDATARSLAFNTPVAGTIGFTSPTLSGTGSKIKVSTFIYVNSTLGYIPLGTPFQIN